MTKAPDFWLDHPPIWELGMSVQTATRGVMDNYDVRGAHDLFRDDLPEVQRHEPVLLAVPPNQELGPEDALYRWWFSSPEGEHLVQLQENLVAWNWRRRQLPPAMPHPYPGYKNTRAAFHSAVGTLRDRAGDKFPEPLACELLYDNFFSLHPPGGKIMRPEEVFVGLNFPPGTIRQDLRLSWREALVTLGEDAELRIQVGAHAVALKDEAPIPVLRMNFSARASVGTWDDAFRFLDESNAIVRRRFLELTTKKAHTIWGLK